MFDAYLKPILGFLLYLTDALAGKVHLLAYLFEGLGRPVEAEAHSQDFLLPGRQLL